MAWKLAQHAAYRGRHFGGFVIDIRDNSKKFLNETAAQVVTLCDGKRGTTDIARTLAERWEAPVDRVQEDVKALLQQMRESDLVEYVPTGSLKVVSAGAKPSPPLKVLSNGAQVGEEPVPRLVDAQIHVTKSCSLRCTHCYNSSGDPMAGELSTPELLDFMDQLKALGAYQITVSGGEPLFHPDIWEILEYARERFVVVLLTNGIHFSNENCQRLKDLKIGEIYVSLDGATAETNNPLRGRNTFKAIVNGVRRGVAHDLPLSLNMAITNDNFHQLDALVDLAKELGVYKVTMTPVVAYGRAEDRDELFLNSDQISDFKLWCFERSKAEPEMTIGELDPGGVPPAQVLDASQKPRKSDLCAAIRGSVTLLPNGDIIPCTLMERPELVTGNIRDSSLHDIWAYSPLHKSLRTLTKDACSVCKDCSIKDLCGGACRAITFIENGSFTGPPATDECAWRQDVFERLAHEVGTDTDGLVQMLGLGS